MSDSEGLFFQFAVAVSKNGIVLFLQGIDGFGDIDASGVPDSGEGFRQS